MAINMRDFASRVENVAGILGAYIESSLKDRSQVESQLKGLAKTIEDYVTDAVAEKVAQATPEQQPLELKIKKLENFTGELPSYQTPGASGFDVCAQLSESLVLKPGQRELVPTGLSFEIPEGYELQARPRSGWAIKQGISLVNTPGTIDADYRGEVKIILINLGSEDVEIQQGQRIAQLVLCPIFQPKFVEIEDLSETERGAGGFGSTGTGEESEVN